MRLRSSLILALVLGGLVWALMSTRRDPAADSADMMTSVLGGRQLLAAKRIIITRGDQVIEIERDGNSFRITEPIRDLASVARLHAIAGVYDTAQMDEAEFGVAVDEQIMQETGLADPQAIFEAQYEDGFKLKIALGLQAALADIVYAMIDEKIYLVSRALVSSLNVNAADLRERLVFRTLNASEVEQITITHQTPDGKESLDLVRKGADFASTSAVDFRLDQSRVLQVINGILSLSADDFIQGTMSLPPMAVPDFIVEVQGGRGKETVEIYRQGDSTVAKAVERNIGFVIKNTRYVQVLEVPISLLRAKWLIPGRVEESKKISIKQGSAVLTLERGTGGMLELREPTRVRARVQATGELVRAFGSLAVLSFHEDGAEDLARYGLLRDFVEVSVLGRMRRVPTTLHIGEDRDAESTYARRSDEPHVVTIPKAAADVFRRPWTEYVHRQILQVTVSTQVMKIRLVDHAVSPPRAVEFRKVDGEWKLEGKGPERDDVAEFFDDELRDLTGTSVFDPGTSDLGPAIDLKFLQQNDSILHSVKLFRWQDEAGKTRLRARRGAPNPGVILYELKIRHSEKLLSLLRD